MRVLLHPVPSPQVSKSCTYVQYCLLSRRDIPSVAKENPAIAVMSREEEEAADVGSEVSDVNPDELAKMMEVRKEAGTPGRFLSLFLWTGYLFV